MSTYQVANDDAVRWLRSLPAQCADAMVTDPPYASGGFSEATKRSSNSSESATMAWFSGDQMGTNGISYLLREVAIEAMRVIKPGGTLSVFSDWRMVPAFAAAIESAGWRWRSMVVWDKGMQTARPMCPSGGFRLNTEHVLHFDRCDGAYFAHTSSVLSVKNVPGKNRVHPTEKPPELFAAIIRVVAPRGGMVLDPFAGSGAIIEGARSVGVGAWVNDRDPVYAEHCRERERAHQPGLDLEGVA